ncbi:MAG TPA: DUF2148 domain-containing protein, partial [Bacillota bacterium]|nr:DUF2148 domain-containing protein [Bacillota bacterium]
MKSSAELEHLAALQVAGLMAAAARTAPKTRGIDNIQVLAIEDAPTRDRLVTKMRELAKSENRPNFERDAKCVAAVPVVVLIGVEAKPAGINCGYCGRTRCEEITSANGVCAFNSIDLGIASSSAVSVAADARVDTRL